MSDNRNALAYWGSCVRLAAFAVALGATAVLAGEGSPQGPAGAADALELKKGPATIEVSTPSRPLLEYAFSGVPYKPYVRAFRTPRGANVLRDSPFDHKHHHALMYAIAAEGVSFWVEDQNSGTQAHRAFEFLGVGRAGGIPAARFVERLDWKPPRSETAILCEERCITVYDPAALGASLLTWATELKPGPGKSSVKLGGEHYYGLGARFLESMDKGGRFLPPKVREGELVRGTERVAPARWCAYAARADGETVTVAMFDHPSNPRAALWFTMEAPFAYISATLNLWREPLVLEAGKTLSVRYGFAAWDGEKDEEAIESAYRKWLEIAAAELSVR